MNDIGQLEAMGQEQVTKIGRIAVEALKRQGIDLTDKVQESIALKRGVAKEDLTIAETDVYTTTIAGFIEAKLKPKLVAQGVIRTISVDQKGADSIKVPVRNTLITASDLPDSGAVSYDTGTYGSTTISMRYVYAAQKITHELLQFANVDLLQENLGEIGDAIARKVDSDIISAFQTATSVANGNLTKLGSSTEITFATLVAGRQSAVDNYAEPNVLLVSPETEATMINLGNFGGSTNVVGSMVVKGGNTEHYPIPLTILGMKVMVSQQVDDDDIYLIDTERTGYLAQKQGVEVFDGRVSGSLAFEVIGAHAFGVGIVQPKAIFRLEENAA